MKNDMTEIWRLYEQGKDYNRRLKPDYFLTVDENERFVFGDQWEGVDSKGLPTPSFNIFKRIINYMVAYLISSPLKIKYVAQNIASDTTDPKEKEVLEAVETLNKIAQIQWEDNKMDDFLKERLHDATVTGDMVAYTYWDADIETGQDVKGDFVTEKLYGVDIYLGNPNDKRINFKGKAFQPYILVRGRDTIERLKEEAIASGVSEEEANKIVADLDYNETAGERGKVENDTIREGGKATFIIKFWYDRKTKTVHFQKAIRSMLIGKEVDSKKRIYPTALQNWDRRINSYHGQALVTNYVPNQKYINKQLAMAMAHYMQLAIPKVIYLKNKVSGWNNKVGAAIGVDGENLDVAKYMTGSEMPAGITNLVEQAIKLTTEALGANDVLLGNINPDNTSAIVQVTEQASIPLLNQKTALYDFVEQIASIWFEFIRTNYGDITRTFTYEEDGMTKTIQFNAGVLLDKIIKPKIEVGPSNWFSENKQVETLDNLFKGGILDVIQYVERMPDGYIPDRDKLLEELKMSMNYKTGQEQMQRDAGYEQMSQFFESLPQDVQAQLRQLPDDQLEKTLMEMMAQQGQQNNQAQLL